jgi:Ni,Fe-hydrogenase maturation factor
MPTEVVVYAVQTRDVKQVTGKMTPVVKAAVPHAVKMIMAEIGEE